MLACDPTLTQANMFCFCPMHPSLIDKSLECNVGTYSYMHAGDYTTQIIDHDFFVYYVQLHPTVLLELLQYTVAPIQIYYM